VKKNLPARQLREHPDIDQLRRQAKELLQGFVAGDEDAVAEVNAHYRGADTATFALHHAQLVLARSYGFDSWPKLKAFVDGVTAKRLAEAVRRNDLTQVRAMLIVRPELVNFDMAENNEHRALHYAVFNRAREMVRLLMQYGADARKGIYPHRSATTALTIATERGYDEIVAIIEEEEQRRRPAPSSAGESKQGTEMTARAAVALGDSDWLRARHAEGTLVNPIEESGGLLTAAVLHDRPEILKLLLDFGFDPDERVRLGGLDDVFYSQAMPLWNCAATGKLEMAEMLLQRGASPNVHVYASGTPVYSAYRHSDWTMLELLKRYGGVVDPVTIGLFHEKELAKQMLVDEAEGRLPAGILEGRNVSEDLLRGAADSGDPDIVRISLEGIDWGREDDRWYWILMQAIWSANTECFRLIIEHCNPNLRHPRFGRTILHDVAGLGGKETAVQSPVLAAMVLDVGGKIDERDDVLKSTPLGWACRWGRANLVKLLLERGAEPVEADAEPWARPRAWAGKMGHHDVLAVLEQHGG
jgi:ankyrin repeat protein